MKKIISTVIAAVMLTVISSSVACAENAAPPVDGMNLWIKAAEGVSTVTEGRIKYVSEWEDLSQNGNDLTPVQRDNSNTGATVYLDAGFDDKTIGDTFTVGSNKEIWTGTNPLYVNGNRDDTQGTSTGVISVVADPKDETGANKVIMVDTDKKTNGTLQFFNYAKKSPTGIQIMQSKIMITGELAKEGVWRAHEEGPIALNLYSTDAGVEIGTSTSDTCYTMNYNEWYDLKCVYDMRAGLYDGNGNPITTSSGVQKVDPSKADVTFYVNNTPIHTKSLNSVERNGDGSLKNSIVPALTIGEGNGDGTKVYVDDFMLYHAPAKPELEIKNYDEMNNSVYLAGTKLKLQAESMIGKDYGVPFDKIEWYCDGERIGTGESVEYTTTVGNHTIYAAGYISANDANEPTLYSSDLVIAVESGIAGGVLMNEVLGNHIDGTATYKQGDIGLKIENTVSFAASQYLQSPAVNYAGDSTFILYFKPRSSNAGTIFSSHSYTGETVTESGSIPFSIAINSEKELVFEMGNFSEELGISVLNENGNLKGYMSLYLSISGNTLSVYSSDTTSQERFEEPQKTIALSESPYLESYAYNLDYDNTTRMSGAQSYIVESIIYKKALNIHEINSVNEYLKLKYEFPILEKMELENEISEIRKGESVPFRVISTGNLIENEITGILDGFTVSSSNTDVITVNVDTMELQAVNFGTSKITISYEGLDDIVFTITVPQVFINPAVIGDLSSGIPPR